MARVSHRVILSFLNPPSSNLLPRLPSYKEYVQDTGGSNHLSCVLGIPEYMEMEERIISNDSVLINI
jgi:hypothetical protein